MYDLTQLDNGLRVLTVSVPHVQSVSIGFFLGVGSRFESDALGGASHFVEHMLFKGTSRRPTARDVADTIEGRGGIFNGSTGVETTLLWAKVAGGHLPEAMDLLSDMLLHSNLDPRELEKERAVIIEEIKYETDTPDSLVEILVSRLQWPDHPLGREIAGSAETVGRLSRDTLLQYLSDHYLPGQAVLAVAGQVRHSKAVGLARALVSGWEPGPPATYSPAPANSSGPRLEVHYKDTEQSHISLSFTGLNRGHPDRHVLGLMSVILGGGMRARLFQQLRETLGLAYSVDCYSDQFADTGSVGVYAGVAPESAHLAIRAILNELDKLRQEPVPGDELQKAKEFSKGRLALALEEPFALASWYARQELLGPDVLSPVQVIAEEGKVVAEDIQRLAQTLFRTERLSLAIVGPEKSGNHLNRAMRF
ncbi:MAG TPA: pitrilysin family protein [Anaerolineae bacterium]|nr:pitrilysin family protein [Anaerolineae bacterium]